MVLCTKKCFCMHVWCTPVGIYSFQENCLIIFLSHNLVSVLFLYFCHFPWISNWVNVCPSGSNTLMLFFIIAHLEKIASSYYINKCSRDRFILSTLRCFTEASLLLLTLSAALGISWGNLFVMSCAKLKAEPQLLPNPILLFYCFDSPSCQPFTWSTACGTYFWNPQ